MISELASLNESLGDTITPIQVTREGIVDDLINFYTTMDQTDATSTVFGTFIGKAKCTAYIYTYTILRSDIVTCTNTRPVLRIRVWNMVICTKTRIVILIHVLNAYFVPKREQVLNKVVNWM